jgi:membrane protease YdiL (CAAX protease family)
VNQAIWKFTGTSFGLSIALSVGVGLSGGHQSRLVGLGVVSMFVPTLGVIVAQDRTDLRGFDWRRLPARYIPIALLLIPVTLHVAMLCRLALAGPIPWLQWLTPAADGLYHTPASRGWGALTAQGLVFRLMLIAAVGVAVVSALAVFEEIGWRAWLLPRLARQFGARRAVVITALIWALWHVPFALSGIQHVDGMSPLRLAFALPFGIAAAGLVIGWLWLRTESVWIVALAHGALNNCGQYAFKFMEDFTVPPPESVLLAGSAALYPLGAVLLTLGAPRLGKDSLQQPPDFRSPPYARAKDGAAETGW